MKRNILNVLSLSVAFILALASCSEKPLVKSEVDAQYAANLSNLATATVSVTLDAKGQTATFEGNIETSVPLIESGFEYSTTENFDVDATKFIVVDSTYMNSSVKLTHLTTYYVRSYAVVADGTAYSEVASVTTKDLPEDEKLKWEPISTKALFKENLLNMAFSTPESAYNVYVEKLAGQEVYRIANIMTEYVSAKGVTYTHPMFGEDILEEEMVTKETTWFIIDLDGTYSKKLDPAYVVNKGEVFTPTNTLNIDWGYGEMRVASVPYNLKTASGPVLPGATYKLGTYDATKKAITFGNLGLYLPTEGWYGTSNINKSVLYLDERLMIEDYNADFQYKTIYKGEVLSAAFDTEWTGQKLQVCKTDTALFYLPDYFDAGNGLAFRINGDKVVNVNNEQKTGLNVFGQDVYCAVKNGKVSVSKDENAFPTITVKIKVYTKDTLGNTITEFGDFEETFVATSGEEVYTADDILGAYKKDYIGTYNLSAKFLSGGFERDDYYNPVVIQDAGKGSEGEELVAIYNLSDCYGYGDTFSDKIIAEWYEGVLYIAPQMCPAPFPYKGDNFDIGAYLFAEETPNNYYKKGYVVAGFTEEGKLAFVSYPGQSANINGFFFFDAKQSFLLDGMTDIFGPKAQAAGSMKLFRPEYKDLNTAVSASNFNVNGSVVEAKRASEVVKTFKPENGKFTQEYKGEFNRNPFGNPLYFFF